MAAASFLRAFYLSHLSKPAGDRVLYRLIQKQKVRGILELGVGDGRRACQMIALAQRVSPGERIQYVGIDLFESRSPADGPGLSLKRAHQILGATGARVQLIPGDPYSALARTANSLKDLDLIVLSSRLDRASLERAWFYFPRILHPSTRVFREQTAPNGEQTLRRVEHMEITRLSEAVSARRAA